MSMIDTGQARERASRGGTGPDEVRPGPACAGNSCGVTRRGINQ